MRDQQRGPMSNPNKENSLPETVSDNTEPIETPSKLDAAGVTESGGQLSGRGTRSEAQPGEHSQVNHQPGRTTSDWQREANQAGRDADISPDTDEQHYPQERKNYIPAANAKPKNLNPQVNPVNREYDTSVNAASGGTNGVDAMRGEHSQVDAMSSGGTTRDWKNMPSSAYKGVAGITDKDRHEGEMSTDWDGTAQSEHPNAEGQGADIRYRSSGGTVSQQQSLGSGE